MTEARLPPDTERSITEHETDVHRFINGELPPHLLRARRVPRGIYEQRRDGRYMVRVRITGGILSPEQLHGLAELSSRWGDGRLHVTTRQDIQLHDVSIEDTVPVLRGLQAVGLTSRGGGGNTVRNVTACSLAGLCPAERFDVIPAAHATTEYLIARKASYNLPRKLKIAFSGCPADCAFVRANDVGFVARERNGYAGFAVYAGGGMGAWSRVGDLVEPWIPASEAVRMAEAWRRFFDRHGNRTNKHRARLRYVFAQRGPDACAEEVRGILKDMAGEAVPDAPEPETCRAEETASGWTMETVDGVRVIPQHQRDRVAIPLHFGVGLVEAADAHHVAQVAKRFGAGLRTTPEQRLLLCHAPRAAIPALAEALRSLSVDALSWNPLNHFVACAGAATCRLGLCLSRDAAKACARSFSEAGIGPDVLDRLDIRINGCINACGQSPIGTIGLMGIAHRVGDHLAPSYRVLLGARHGETMFRTSDTVALVPARRLGEALVRCLQDFERNRMDGEPFADYFDRRGPAYFKKLWAPFEDFPPHATHRELYRDWGCEEEFSLAGRGAGECGAGVFEVVQGDLAAAEKSEDPFSVLLHAARALLIVRGVDAQEPDAVFREFEQQFIDAGLVSEAFRPLLARARGYREGWASALDGKEEDIEALRKRVEWLFSTLDGNLEFHPADTPSGERPGVPGAGVTPGAPIPLPTAVELDLRGVACPMNFVKAKLRLETLSPGERLALVLDDGEPIQNVPASLRNEGQEIESIADLGDGHWRVLVRKQSE